MDEYTRSLGDMKTPGALVVARTPIANVPVCVVSSVSKCVLKRTQSVGEMASMSEKVCAREAQCVKETACVSEMACVSSMLCVGEMACVDETPVVSERRCVRGTACVRWRYEREMAVSMRENATACESVMVRCVSVVARGSLCARVQRRRRQIRDKGRRAAIAVLGTAPGLHGSEREVRAVLRTRPPRALLRE